jgi:hypothetical protein
MTLLTSPFIDIRAHTVVAPMSTGSWIPVTQRDRSLAR